MFLALCAAQSPNILIFKSSKFSTTDDGTSIAETRGLYNPIEGHVFVQVQPRYYEDPNVIVMYNSSFVFVKKSVYETDSFEISNEKDTQIKVSFLRS